MFSCYRVTRVHYNYVLCSARDNVICNVSAHVIEWSNYTDGLCRNQQEWPPLFICVVQKFKLLVMIVFVSFITKDETKKNNHNRICKVFRLVFISCLFQKIPRMLYNIYDTLSIIEASCLLYTSPSPRD